MKVALVGHGMVAQTHIRALSDSKDVIFRGLLGRDENRAEAFLNASGFDAMAYENLAALCDDPEVDFAIVATPPNARVEIIRALAEANIPILMEKPVERTLRAAAVIADICEGGDVLAGVLFQHRARQASGALKRLITEGQLGEIVAAEIRVPWWRDQTYYDEPGRGSFERDGGGVMISQAIHTLDLAIWLLGPVRTVQAAMHTTQLHKMESEDWAGALLGFANGAVATLSATTAFFPGAAESISLQGTKAHAHLENGVTTISYLDKRVEILGEDSAGTGGGADPMAFTHAWHQSVIEDFADCVRSGRAPLCSVREALQVHTVIDAMERAAKSGEVVNLQ